MAIFICDFSAGLDGMKRKDQSDAAKVLQVLEKTGRFSVFEATANPTIARTMTRLCTKGAVVIRDGHRTEYGKLIETDNTCGYPWTKVKLTDAGRRYVEDWKSVGAIDHDASGEMRIPCA